jgi:hypothetical protein
MTCKCCVVVPNQQGELLLNNQNLSYISVKRILATLSLRGYTNIQKVDLSCNENIGDIGAVCLQLIPATVSEVDISYCNIGAVGMRHICDFMKSNTTITTLNLIGNRFDEKCATFIGEMLRENSTLKVLRAYQYGDGEKRFKYYYNSSFWFGGVAEGLMHNNTLRVLEMVHRSHDMDKVALDTFNNALCNGGGSAIERLSIGRVRHSFTFQLSLNAVENLGRTGVADYINRIAQQLPKAEEAFGLLLSHLFKGSKNLYDMNLTKWLEYPHQHPHAREVQYWMELNTVKARQVTEDGDFVEFVSAVAEAARSELLDSIYYLVRNNIHQLPTY